MITNFDLEERAKKLKLNLVWIGCKDQIPYKRKNGCYILNLQDDKDVNGNDNPGSHWCSFIIDKGQACYYDPFGFQPPRQVQEFLKPYKPFPYNTKQIQDIKSEVCGYHCLYFLFFMQNRSGSMVNRLKLFQSRFSDDPKKNEGLLKKYIRPL